MLTGRGRIILEVEGLAVQVEGIGEQVGVEPQNVAAVAVNGDFTVIGGTIEAREARELLRLVVNLGGLQMDKPCEIDTAQPFHLAFVHRGDVLDLGRLQQGQILLRDHPSVEDQRRADILKLLLEPLQ